MERYGVGRGAVREAIQSLVAMGVLDVRPGRGAVVIGISAQDALDPETIAGLLEDQAIDDLYDFRELLEGEAAARAAASATPAELAAITAALARIRSALVDGASSYQADLDFHRAIVAASNNVIYLRVLDAITDLLATVRHQTELVPGAAALALGQHETILSAIARGDAETARKASVEHIASGRAAVAEARRMRRATSPVQTGTGRSAAQSSEPQEDLVS
jgi:GntR family transcriptional repressor for pyruvate dehydrogenase complex